MKLTCKARSQEEANMTNREQLLQELEQAPDELIIETLNFVRSKLKQSAPQSIVEPQQPRSPEEQIQQLKEWIATLPKNDTPLPEEALHRDSMYD
ncbi:hypothetical protein H6F51_17030 [Cyanobacteria bacterium FACHB-DQ100]|nr:hypothetical protein [Cyanobacteria bacterium FACHB-DQ100]